MAKLNVNPTRMELGKLKIKLVTAKKGHKLLKDKQDELMRNFIELIKENKKLRANVEKKLKDSLNNFLIAKSLMNDISYNEALSVPAKTFNIKINVKNAMGVEIPKLEIEDKEFNLPYSFLNTTIELDDAIVSMNETMKDLIKLSEIEKSTQLMADEIEKTRRRVNALEYLTIPQLEETIKFIIMKLDENDRASTIRLMKAEIN